MADAPKDAPEAGRILIRNIGLLLTGDLDQPIADSDCLLIEDGVIIGLEQGDADRVIDAGGCAGIKRNVISVMMPRVPSLPTNSLVSESPATSLRRGPPRLTAVPSASTTRSPRT